MSLEWLEGRLVPARLLWVDPVAIKVSEIIGPLVQNTGNETSGMGENSQGEGTEATQENTAPGESQTEGQGEEEVVQANAGVARWSDQGRFRNMDTAAKEAQVPAAGDTLVFDPSVTLVAPLNSYKGSADWCIADLAVTLAGLRVESSYTGVITLNNDLTLTSEFFLGQARLDSPQGRQSKLTIDPGQGSALAEWQHGNMKLDLVTKANTTLRVGQGQTHILDGKWDNAGIVNWEDGDIMFTNTLTNQSAGIFNIKCENDLRGFHWEELVRKPDDPPLANLPPSFVNEGSVFKLGGGGGPKATIKAPFENKGLLTVNFNTLAFTESVTQTGASAKTEVRVNTTIECGTFTLSAGELGGAGLISGNVTNSGGIVKPYARGPLPVFAILPGQFTIVGNYSQGAAGTLEILFTAAGTSHLRILGANNVGGNATLRGNLRILRDINFNPAPAPNPWINFVSYAALTPNPNLVVLVPGGIWLDANGIRRGVWMNVDFGLNGSAFALVPA